MAITVNAQTPKDVKYVFTEASELNIIGKIHNDTPNPYHRVDTIKYKGFTDKENKQVRCPAGLNVYFIQPNATDELHETSVDGTHPGDLGYTLWAKSIQKPLLKILKKYGIK